MTKRIKRLFQKFRLYREAIGGRDLALCILDQLLRRERVRRIRVGNVPIHIRTATKDLRIAVMNLHKREYDHVRAANPRVIVDAGAHIGTATVFFAEKYPAARIVAVEPEQGNFALLQQNTRPYPNVVALQAAIWGAAGKRPLQSRRTGHWGYTVSDTFNRVESTGQETDCLTIRALMDRFRLEKIDLLKMDIEGAEKNVLENSADWIDAVDVLTVELHDRICPGCEQAFFRATRNFKTPEPHGEQMTAYRP